MANTESKKEHAGAVIYGDKNFTLIISYAHAKRLKMPGMERNHLIPKAFFEKGPRETRALADYIPVLPLTFDEHRGAKHSFHNMGNGGLNSYLAQLGLGLKKSSYTQDEISRAIAACYKYHADMGIHHAAAAIRSFQTRFYYPAAHSTSNSA